VIAIETILERARSLPPLPDTAVRLMTVINDPRSKVEDIVTVIKYDQALTGEVLRLCNSAYFGLSRTVTSLSEAMVCLGTIKVLQIVMAVHTTSLLSREQSGYGLARGILWKHSVAAALAASHFGQLFKLPNANLLFTTGLLHDIGKVVLSEYVGEEFQQIVERVTTGGESFCEAEKEVLGLSHDEIGGMIAEQWKLPDVMVRCIRYHHNPDALDVPDPLIDAVYLADVVCMLLGIGIGSDGLWYRASPAVLARHALNERDLEMVGVQVLCGLQNVEELFGSTAPNQAEAAARR
jgi:putative nucleotidyltransferase with HDIG domain